MNTVKPQNISEYIAGFPPDIRQILEQIRTTIQKSASDAEECISYNMPTFKLKEEYLLHFAAYKNHIGVYPLPAGDRKFLKQVSEYKTSGKGSIQFPVNRPIPLDLIKEIVKFRIIEITRKIKSKK